MSTPLLVIAFALSLLFAPFASNAQPTGNVARIGILGSAPDNSSVRSNLAVFTQVLRHHGYIAGQNVAIEYRFPTGQATWLSDLAGELIQLKADVILAVGPAALDATRQATTTIPLIAMDLERDPVASGLVERYSRPGGNITGVFLDLPEFSGKWLELLREIVPELSQVAVPWDPATGPVQVRGLKGAARALGVELHLLEVRRGDEFEGAFRAAMTGHPGALIALSSPVFNAHRRQLAALAATHRLPAIMLFPGFAHEGGLMAYGPNLTDLFRQAGVMVAKILNGAKPADLPIERPMKFELVINLKIAQALGLTIPPTLLFQADEVIR